MICPTAKGGFSYEKSFIRKPISVLLSLLMLLSVFSGMAFAADASNYYGVEVAATALRTGDLFEMGMYPQSKVTDEELLASLSQIECEMRSYGYLKNADAATGDAETVDMQYADIVFDGELYRKVTINEKRPHSTKNTERNNDYNTQADNGYFVGRTYYFKWEPIIWRVLAKESDGVTVTSHYLLDAQTYNDYFGAVPWETSSLRAWLNNDFLQLAFSEAEQEKLVTVEKEHDDNPDLGVSGGNDTLDTLWILSLKEVVRQDCGFRYTNDADASKVSKGTEYAKSQGLWVASNGNGDWWQRTPGGASTLVCEVNSDGATRNIYEEACVTSNGVRPAFKLNLNAIVGVFDPAACRIAGHTEGEPVAENIVDATCTEAGSYDVVTYCEVCGEELHRVHKSEAALGHTEMDSVIENKVEATCTTDGGYDEVTYCTVCSEELSRTHKTIQASGHAAGEAQIENFVEPTCGHNGSYAVVVRCTVCGEMLQRTDKTLAATAHTPSKPVVESIVEATTEHEGSYVLVTYCETCGEELSRETVTTPKLTPDQPSEGNACPWCGKTVHHTVWEDFVHSVFSFIKVMFEKLKITK